MICPYFKSSLFWHYFWNFGLPRFVLSSFIFANWFGTEFREIAFYLVQRNGIPSCVLFRGLVWNGIPRICIYFCSTERTSELFSLPKKGSEQNYGSLLLFLFHGTEFRVVFSSAEGFGTEFRDFLFRETTGIPSEITICSVYSVFRGIIFLSEIPNPSWTTVYRKRWHVKTVSQCHSSTVDPNFDSGHNFDTAP